MNCRGRGAVSIAVFLLMLGLSAAAWGATGTIMWTPDGVGVRTAAPHGAGYPQITPDGAGGAIITWQDWRSGKSDIYAQRVDASGNCLWTPDGVGVRTAAPEEARGPQITTDGAGGAVIIWYDLRAGKWDIYAQRVDASGNCLWTPDGVGVRTAAEDDALKPQITTDGAGGAIITWYDLRAVKWDIYAQRVDASGNCLWTPDGVGVRTAAPLSASDPQIISDGDGGAIITWEDPRSRRDIYAQRVDASGNCLWTLDGVGVCTLISLDAWNPQIISDGGGGGIITWQDWRSGERGIYAQWLDMGGNPLWGPGGVGVRTAAEKEASYPQIAPDGAGGAIITWQDTRSDRSDIYAQRVGTEYTFYFAEGYTGTGFQEYLCLGQPADEPLDIRVTFLFKGGEEPMVKDYRVPALSRLTIDVNGIVGPGRDVSVKCEAFSPFVAERPMYFKYQGAWTGGHDVVGASAPADTWYFAEGYTGAGFDEWICVLNPGDDAADLTFRFQTQEEGEKVVTDLSVPAHSRGSFKANDLLGGAYQTSLTLESTQPVVAERPMYFSYSGTGGWGWSGGHCVMGASSLASEYYFAEGTTRGGFEEWLTIQNPGLNPIDVQATYMLGSGETVEKTYPVPAAKRSTIYVPGEVGKDQDVSVKLACSTPFLAERPMYFEYMGMGGWGWTGGHCVVGAMESAQEWFFAEGYTGTGFEEWLCIQNPGDTGAAVAVTYYPEGGAEPITREHEVAANSRYTIPVNVDAGTDMAISAEVTSNQALIVERPMYFNYNGTWPGGHDVVGYAP